MATRSHSAQGEREISFNKGDRVKGESVFQRNQCVWMCMPERNIVSVFHENRTPSVTCTGDPSVTSEIIETILSASGKVTLLYSVNKNTHKFKCQNIPLWVFLFFNLNKSLNK